MKTPNVLSEKIIEKLEFFKYRYTADFFNNKPAETIVKVYLPMFCYLKISFFENHIKLTSRIQYGFDFLSLELNYLIYTLVLLALSLYGPETLGSVIYLFFAVIILHFLACLVKLEFMKTTIHRWIENELDKEAGTSRDKEPTQKSLP